MLRGDRPPHVTRALQHDRRQMIAPARPPPPGESSTPEDRAEPVRCGATSAIERGEGHGQATRSAPAGLIRSSAAQPGVARGRPAPASGAGKYRASNPQIRKIHDRPPPRKRADSIGVFCCNSSSVCTVSRRALVKVRAPQTAPGPGSAKTKAPKTAARPSNSARRRTVTLQPARAACCRATKNSAPSAIAQIEAIGHQIGEKEMPHRVMLGAAHGRGNSQRGESATLASGRCARPVGPA